MPAPIEQLQTAGFSESEIGDWAKEQRATLSSAGFGQDEIDDYLQGPPPRLEGFLRRVSRAIDPVAVATQFGADFARGFKQGGGTSPLFSPEMEGDMRTLGLFGGPGSISPTAPITEPLIRGVAAGLRLMQAAATGLKEAVPPIGGPLLASFEAFPAGHFTGFPTAVKPLSRIEHGPTGEPRSVPIGDLPQPSDFTDTARIVAQGDAEGATAARGKIEALWNEHGIHPSEVAHDIATDPTIAQDLLADDHKLPSAYVRDSEQPSGRSPAPIVWEAEPAATHVAETEPAPQRPPEAAAASPQIGSFTPDQLKLDPQRFQFKEGTDESGLSQRLQGVQEWDPIKASLGIVWEDNQGDHWIVDGHQRLGLARRIREADPGQDPRMNAWVLREAEGVTDADVRAMAAAKNIAEGTGSPIDAAKVLRDRPDLLPSLPPRSELVRQAQGLTKLDTEGFGKVVNGVVPANYAAIVGRLVPEGPDMPGMQNALLDLLAKTKPENATQAESIVRQGLDSGTHKELQQSLFGPEETVSSLYALRAQLLDRAFKQLRRDRFVFSTLVDNQSIIEELGNQLAQDENLRRAATDGQAVQILQTLANRRGPLGDALTAAARSVAESGASPAAAARDFVAELRRQAASGDLARIADGGTSSPVAVAGKGNEPPAAEPGRVEPERNPRDVAPAEEARAADQVERTINPPAIEQTDQGAQLVIPGAERSAQQAMEARDAEGHGRIAPKATQEEPGGLFEPPSPDQPGFEWGPETGAIANPFAKAELPRTPAEKAILDHIDVGGAPEKRGLSWRGFMTAIVDRLDAVRVAESQAADSPLPAEKSPYRLGQLLSGNAGRARHWLEFGQLDLKTGAVIGPSLDAIMAPVKADLDGFRAFASSLHALELEHLGVETGFNISAAKQVVVQGLDKYAPVLRDLVRFQNNLAKYLADAEVLSPEGVKAMTDKYSFYVPFHRLIGDDPMVGGSGKSMQPRNPIHNIKGSELAVIDPLESIVRHAYLYTEMAQKNIAAKTLVDLLRDADMAEKGGPRTILTATGPAAHFPEPGAVAMPTGLDPTYAAAIRSALDAAGLSPELFDFVAAGAPLADGEIKIFRNGKPEVWQVGREVGDAARNLSAPSAGWLAQWLSSDNPWLRLGGNIVAGPARLLRAGATLSPDFMVRNPLRDFTTAAIQSNKTIYTPWDSLKGGLSAINKDEYFQKWLANGGGNAELVAMDRRYLQDSLEKLTEQTGLMNRGWNVIRHPIDVLRALSELSEQATRLGEFRGIYDREIKAGATPQEAAIRAAASARDVTVDFARIGAATQSMNLLTAFWNAQVQGVHLLARNMAEHPSRTALRIATWVTLPSVVLWAVNHDDPDYKELPRWQKDFFYVIPIGSTDPSPIRRAWAAQQGMDDPGRSPLFYFRWPKSFELGVIFGSGAERLLDAFVDHAPDAARDFAKAMIQSLLPGATPTGVLPMVEQYANMSSFTDRKLIPAQMEKLVPEIQYQPYTTETAKALGRNIAAVPGLRDAAMGDGPLSGTARALSTPILLENYLRGWTGGLGTYMLQIADVGLRKSGVLPDPPKPADTLADIPVIKAFVARHPSGSAESLALFYEEYDKNKRYFDSWMAKAKEGDLPAMEAIQQAGGPRIFVQLNAIHEALGEHSKLIREIWKDPETKPEEKRQLIDGLYYSQIQIAQAGRTAMRAVDQGIAAEAALKK